MILNLILVWIWLNVLVVVILVQNRLSPPDDRRPSQVSLTTANDQMAR
jgi:hypothetical protein